jgi:hypothetical protein
MKRRTGYLANWTTTPPLIFRFQFNPELMSEKKSFNYREVNNFGDWRFDRAKGTSGVTGFITGALDDLKEWGSLLVGTKALEADVGSPRTFALDFALDARRQPDLPDPLPVDEEIGDPAVILPLLSDDERLQGRIQPSLAVLRSFLMPSWDLIDDVLPWIGGSKSFCGPTRPPQCNLKLGDADLECVMTDLNIKITHFKTDLTPNRAEVSLTLKEQTHSIATSLDAIGRIVEVAKSYTELSREDREDLVQTLPAAGTLQALFEH